MLDNQELIHQNDWFFFFLLGEVDATKKKKKTLQGILLILRV